MPTQMMFKEHANYLQTRVFRTLDACDLLDWYQWENALKALTPFVCTRMIEVGYTTDNYYHNDKSEVITFMPKSQSNSERAKWKGFINIDLSKSDKPKLDAFRKKYDEDLTEPLASLLTTGHSISIKWDDRSSCFMSAMRCDDPESENGGYCVTSRSPDFVEAMWMALYKHEVVTGGTWKSYDDDPMASWG